MAENTGSTSTARLPGAPGGSSSSPRLSPSRLSEDLRRSSPVWDEEFDQLTRSMQERMDDFFRTPQTAAVAATAAPDRSRGRMERQPDGSLLFRVTFDVHGYEPGDLKTSLIGDRTVRVCGSINRQDPQTGKQTSASFDEQFSLPDNVDPGKLRSVVSNGQLIISAPVLPPQYTVSRSQPQQQQLPPQQHHHQHQLYTSSAAATGSPRLSPRSGSPSFFGQPMSTAQQLQQSQQRPQSPQLQQQQGSVRTVSAYQLEVDVGREFEPQDLTVATVDGGRRLAVHGRREVKAAGKSSMREFRDEFDLPNGVDTDRVTARLRNDGKVIVDMPLLRDTAGFTYWPVAVDHRS